MLLITLAYLGGVLTILSPCILPVLPVVLFSGTSRAPYRVVAGLVLSFSVVTLLGTVVLQQLHLPDYLLCGVFLTCAPTRHP